MDFLQTQFRNVPHRFCQLASSAPPLFRGGGAEALRNQKAKGENQKMSKSETQATAAYYWSKIRQELLEGDNAGAVVWALTAGVSEGAAVADLLRERVLSEFGDGKPTMDQIISAVQEARP
jgi:hypothetical protein